MNKIELVVPTNVRYLSEWEGFELPNGILNKGLTGCGGTTLALIDSNPTIICSPRTGLLINKNEQHTDTLLVRGGVYKDDIENYLKTAKTPKILTTYDSLYKVIDCIEDFEGWRVVVDEFQCILQDASFKSEVELKMISNLKKLPYVTYLSATPILDEFIEQIDIFDDINYYVLKWQNVDYVKIHRQVSGNPSLLLQKIVERYEKGDYFELDGVESKELCIYLNSVTKIANCINNCGLKAEDVNIIVANNSENSKLLKQIGDEYEIGTAPLKGEEHKKYTFCTSTAFIGMDFYSENATTVVVSDTTYTPTTLDIATDLVQIAGRQRLASNPFRKDIIFIYNTAVEEMSEDEFMKDIRQKEKLTKDKCDFYNTVSENLKEGIISDVKKVALVDKFQTDYTYYNPETDKFEENRLAKLAEVFSYHTRTYNYKNGVAVAKSLENNNFTVESTNFNKLAGQVKNTIQRTDFRDKMKKYCELKECEDKFIIAVDLVKTNPEIKLYYDALGADKIKALDYRKNRLKEAYEAVTCKDKIFFTIRSKFTKDLYTAKEAKEKLKEIYTELGINVKVTAKEIEKFGFKQEVKKINGATTRVFTKQKLNYDTRTVF